ncbi:MAG: hypothetical protein JNG83_01860 [Opitutaceae bacterium]|nr:hypothetical protein [Opitutaceae bacterium]
MKIEHFIRRRNAGGIGVKLLLVLAVLAAVVALLWVALLPRVVTSAIHSRTGFKVQVERLSVNPFTANVAIRGLLLQNPDGWPEPAFVDLREFRANAELFSLFGDRFVADEVVVDVANLTLVKNAQGTLNATAFNDSLSGQAEGEPSSGGGKRKFLIRHLVLKFDQMVFIDHTGARPVTKEYNLKLSRDLRDVDSVAKIVSPFTGSALGLVSDALGLPFKASPDLIKDLTGTLQDAGKKTGEKLKGLLDSLDKKKP